MLSYSNLNFLSHTVLSTANEKQCCIQVKYAHSTIAEGLCHKRLGLHATKQSDGLSRFPCNMSPGAIGLIRLVI